MNIFIYYLILDFCALLRFTLLVMSIYELFSVFSVYIFRVRG